MRRGPASNGTTGTASSSLLPEPRQSDLRLSCFNLEVLLRREEHDVECDVVFGLEYLLELFVWEPLGQYRFDASLADLQMQLIFLPNIQRFADCDRARFFSFCGCKPEVSEPNSIFRGRPPQLC